VLLIVVVKPQCRGGKDQITALSAIRGKNIPTKCWCPPASLHGVITLLAPKMNLHRCGNMKLYETVKE